MQDIFNEQERQERPFADTLQIYRARVVSKPDPGDDRLQVRIIPHMIDLPEEEALPTYPPFFKGQVVVTKTERRDKDEADYVWVAALPDFTLGFVLGPATSYETTNQTSFSQSYNYRGLIEGLIRRGVATNETSYKDLFVQYWNDTYLEMNNIRTGDKYLILSSGTMIAMTNSQIYMRVGAEDTSSGGSSFSAIRMTKDEINFVTNHFRVKANNVTLGNKGLYVTGLSSVIPLTVKGATLHPQTNIKV